MPFTEIMPKFKDNLLHMGSKSGPLVKNRKQAIAIMLSEKKKGTGLGPSENLVSSKFNKGMK